MELIRAADRQTRTGTTFTGEVTLEAIVGSHGEGVSVAVVRFSDGARTHWHEHPGEQILYILEGEGRVGTADEQYLVYPGDVVHAAPGERHWHGAAPGQHMAHISITTGGGPTWYDAPEE